MEQYNWTGHYAGLLRESGLADPFRRYDLENETGSGKVLSCAVFPGVQAVYNDLNMQYSSRAVSRNEGILEISYCMDGRYECQVSSQYCFYVSHGDLSIGTAGRRESGGGFPTKRYSGLTLFLDLAGFREQCGFLIEDLGIDLCGILSAAIQSPRRCILRGVPEIDGIMQPAIDAQISGNAPLLKLKTLELLLFLCQVDFEAQEDMPAYLNRTQAALAQNAQRRLTSDLTVHVTLAQLSAELHASPTAIKSAFRAVYGESMRDYMKACRLNEAQRLLRETELPVAEVAALVGYQNPGHFSAAFREKYGVSPGEYKKA